MTVSADAQGYITRPIHAMLIMTEIVIESHAFRRIQSVVASFKARYCICDVRSRDS